ncbi:MAG: 4-oxalocrotonate tautomerase family protein [Gammaproteobacteria bacterium]|nr:4-oxalocrotonate tautomerase family protein [Gammaproteobacteria bacterium]
MPIINVKLIEGVFSSAQKKTIIEDLTEAMVAIEGENLRELTWVYIEEIKQGDLGIGGKTLGASDVQKVQRGQ